MIQEYRFGKMVIDGEAYDKDLVIAKGKVIPNWWRDKGHLLQLSDLKKVLEENQPEVVVIGKGQFGMMSISDEFLNFLHERNIELQHKKTGKAVQIFNKYYNQGKDVMGAFHLTC